jgi:hypothetical protein
MMYSEFFTLEVCHSGIIVSGRWHDIAYCPTNVTPFPETIFCRTLIQEEVIFLSIPVHLTCHLPLSAYREYLRKECTRIVIPSLLFS